MKLFPLEFSLRLRLAMMFAAASSAMLGGIGVYLADSLYRSMIARDVEEMAGKVELVRNVIAKAATPESLKRDSHLLDQALVGHPHLHLSVESLGGVVYASSPLQIPAELRGNVFRHDQVPWRVERWTSPQGATYHFVMAEYRDRAGANRATITVAADFSEEMETLRTFRRNVIAGGAVGIVLSAILGWFIAGRGLAPLRSMADAVRQITVSRLDQRIDLAHVLAELRELAGSFNQMLAHLEEAFRRLSDFSSDLAHEMRTPVNTLLVQSQVALSKSRSPETYREILESGVEELERLSAMISDMLFLAQAEDARAALKKEPIELAPEFERIAEFYGLAAEERGISVESAGNAIVMADRLMLERALGNLLSNALRHAAPDSVVRLTAESSAGQVVVGVRNTGDRIPPDELGRVFDRFYRADKSRQRASGGTGLGLAIVQSIMELHGGTVRVESSEERGTVFSLLFPVAATARSR